MLGDMLGNCLRRRDLVLGLGCWAASAAGLALLGGCEQAFSEKRAAVARVGVLSGYPRASTLGSQNFDAFSAGMRELGWIEGQSIQYLTRYLDDGPLPKLASELVRSGVDVIVTLTSINATLAARDASSSIPIVFTATVDPVAVGLIDSLAHPGGNITGDTGPTEPDPRSWSYCSPSFPAWDASQSCSIRHQVPHRW